MRGLTSRQEAFCKLVALEDVPVTEAVQRVYRDQQHASAYGRTLRRNPKIRSRLERLQQQRETIARLSRDSLTVAALETSEAAREDKSYSASISGLRLVGDLQGMLTQNPIAEQTVAFLQFLAGDGGKPAVEAEARLLDS
ncbi:MAG: terminase small subunit [Chloroflexi bacterium]|nr:terminase small subunit [Chloroflexota bacterium]